MSESLLNKNGMYRMSAIIKKDNVILDLSGGQVYILLRKPNGELITELATIDSAVAGTVHYDTTSSDLDTVGKWSRAWQVILGSLDTPTDPIRFTVRRSP